MTSRHGFRIRDERQNAARIGQTLTPIIREVSQWPRPNIKQSITSPLHAWAEWIGMVYNLAKCANKLSDSIVIEEGVQENIPNEIIIADLCITLYKSVVHLWSNEMRLAALHNMGDLPPHYVKDVVWPHENIWSTWSDDMLVSSRPELSGVGTMCYKRDGFFCIVEMLANVETGCLHVIPVGRIDPTLHYPEFVSDLTNDPYGGHVKLLSFLSSKITQVERTRVELPRPMRRRLSKVLIYAPDISVVQLRNFDNQPRYESKDPTSPDWQYRWIVSGHWRRQWYASTESHQLIWVAPYLKGPEDKPLKQTVYNVVR